MTDYEPIDAPERLEVDKLDNFFREMGGIRYYKPMQRIINDGDEVDGLYLLTKGVIGFYKKGVNVGVQSSKESTFFGELGLIRGDTQRAADVVSLTECEVRVVYGNIDEILKSRLDIAKTLMINNVNRLLKLNDLLQQREKQITDLRSKRIQLTKKDLEELEKMFQMAMRMDDFDNRWLTARRMLEVIEGAKPPAVIRRFLPDRPISSLLELLAQRKKERLIDPGRLKPAPAEPEKGRAAEGKPGAKKPGDEPEPGKPE